MSAPTINHRHPVSASKPENLPDEWTSPDTFARSFKRLLPTGKFAVKATQNKSSVTLAIVPGSSNPQEGLSVLRLYDGNLAGKVTDYKSETPQSVVMSVTNLENAFDDVAMHIHYYNYSKFPTMKDAKEAIRDFCRSKLQMDPDEVKFDSTFFNKVCGYPSIKAETKEEKAVVLKSLKNGKGKGWDVAKSLGLVTSSNQASLAKQLKNRYISYSSISDKFALASFKGDFPGRNGTKEEGKYVAYKSIGDTGCLFDRDTTADGKELKKKAVTKREVVQGAAMVTRVPKAKELSAKEQAAVSAYRAAHPEIANKKMTDRQILNGLKAFGGFQ